MSSLQPGLTGLQNLENTCYMNAVLQCLCSLTPLVQYFLSGRWNTALHEWVGLFTVLRAFCLALFSFQRIRVAMGMSKAPASSPQAAPVTLATSWFPSPLRAQLLSLLGPSVWYFSCHIDGNTHYCCQMSLSHFLGSAESLKPSDSCQSWAVPASVFWVSVLCSHLKASTIFSYITWNSPLFSKGDWRICDCLWLFGVRHVAWRVWLCLPWGFSFHLWEAVPSFYQDNSTWCTGVPNLCAGWPPWGFQGGKSPAVVFWELQLFPLHFMTAFHVIIAYCPLLNSMMGPLVNNFPFLPLFHTYVHTIINLLLV